MLVENFFFRNPIFFLIFVISDLSICYNLDSPVSDLTVTLLTCLLYPILSDHLIALLSHDNAYITFCQEVHIDEISFIKQQTTFSINNKNVIRENLNTNDQYVAQKIKSAYLAFFYQSKTSFDLSYVVQMINFSANDIISLNKRLK